MWGTRKEYFQVLARVERNISIQSDDKEYILRINDIQDEENQDQALILSLCFCFIVRRLIPEESSASDINLQLKITKPVDFPTSIAGINFSFSNEHNQLVMPSHWRSARLASRNKELQTKATIECQSRLEDIYANHISRMIEKEIETSQNYSLSLHSMAEILNISPSTLQRRLREEKTSFRDIKNNLLTRKSRELLLTTRKSIDQISDDLGFCDTSSFTKFFKNSNQTTPSAFRKKKTL